jgi:hypothetical protein
MKKKKVNPRKRPASMSDVERAKAKAMVDALRLAEVLIFTVLLDKQGFDDERLLQVWHQVGDLSDSVNKGIVSVKDLETVLKEEYGIFRKEG